MIMIMIKFRIICQFHFFFFFIFFILVMEIIFFHEDMTVYLEVYLVLLFIFCQWLFTWLLQAELYRVRKAFEKAEPLYLEAISILEESFGADDIRYVYYFHIFTLANVVWFLNTKLTNQGS